MRKCLGITTALLMLHLFAIAQGGAVSAFEPPKRIPPLDSLAANMSTLRILPAGGELPLLAAASGWFGLISDTRIIPTSGSEFRQVISDTTGEWYYCGYADWGASGHTIMVLAPAPWVLPEGLDPAVSVGQEIVFTLNGYWSLPHPAAAVRTPSMEVLNLKPDSTGLIGITIDVKGLYWIEVMHSGVDGPAVSLLFPIVAGGTAMDVLSGDIPLVSSNVTSLNKLFEEMNRLRSDIGVPDLQASAILDSIARSRACELALTSSTSHLGPGQHGLLLPLLPSGTSIFAENIGRGIDFAEAWSLIMLSPFHLRTVLSDQYTHAGLGVALESTMGEWEMVLVQVFTGGDTEE